MKLKLTVESGARCDDVVMVLDSTVTVGMLASRLGETMAQDGIDPFGVRGTKLTFEVDGGGNTSNAIDPEISILESGIRSGDHVRVVPATDGPTVGVQAVGRLRVISGVDSGREFPLMQGSTSLGRDATADVVLSDDSVSRRHLRFVVGETIEVIDENSANGVLIDGESVQRAEVRPGQIISIGETEIVLERDSGLSVDPSGRGRHVNTAFNRSPRLDPVYVGTEFLMPEPPGLPHRQRVPLAPLLAPLLMAAVMYAVTRNVLSVLFAALSPLMIVGSYLENGRNQRLALREATETFHENLAALRARVEDAIDLERTGRGHESPSAGDVVASIFDMGPLLWTRRPDSRAFLEVRLGTGTRPTRHSVKLPTGSNPVPELWAEVIEFTESFSSISDVPIVADLRSSSGLGICGPSDSLQGYTAGVLTQVAGLHSPAEVALAAIVSKEGAARWNWLKWLPHVGSDHSPLDCDHLASSPAAAAVLISGLEELITMRRPAMSTSTSVEDIPAVVLLVEEEAVHDRARLVEIIERGRDVGVFVIWTSTALRDLPAACRVFVDLGDADAARAGYVIDGEEVTPLRWDRLEKETSEAIGRWLSPVTDASSLLEDQSDLPRSVSFLTLAGPELAEDPLEVIERWRGSNSLPAEEDAPPLRRDNTLRALVGQAAGDRFYLDLRSDGPHALVGGTTGAGKSEFLQSWVLGIAASHSPSRVNFLFVDYKGGAAFAECVRLPHCVGLVTDLNPFLVRRALRSLNAELRRREHILTAKKAKDLLELERRRDPEAPPSLVIVVDEFAALVSEVPEFVDGVVNVAQRGRSLGLHLVLATQRPAGVIKDNLRANTNLRVAMRMADESDSVDVLGSAQAASFDPSIPGRSMAKSGPRSLTAFQSAYVGGHTSATPPPPSIDVWQFEFGTGLAWDPPQESVGVNDEIEGDQDIVRIVDTISAAFETAGLPVPQRPWLPELTETYVLEDLQGEQPVDGLVFGTSDLPDLQAQSLAVFRPDVDGNMVVFGTGGSGRSALLRALAYSAGHRSVDGDAHEVHVLDMAAKSLQMLEVLPHVGSVIAGEEHERITNLLKMLRATIDQRASRFADVRAGSLGEFRERSGDVQTPRILLLLDGYGAFRQAYETGPYSGLSDVFHSIVAEGRSVGVHVVLTADRPGAVPSSLAANLQRRVVLRLASEFDYASLDVSGDMFTGESPPGRGLLGEFEIQTAVPGGFSDLARQATRFAEFAEEMRARGVQNAPTVRSLPTKLSAQDVPAVLNGSPVLGIWDEDLEPITFDPESIFLVTGPPGSGRTSTVAWMVHALGECRPSSAFVLMSPSRSSLAGVVQWSSIASSLDEIVTASNEMRDSLRSGNSDADELVLVIESVGDLLGTPAGDALADLVGVCKDLGRMVIVEGERSTVGGSWPLLALARSSGAGLALQPEQFDGANLFKTEFPRIVRSDFPVGRGLYVRRGRFARVQIPQLI